MSSPDEKEKGYENHGVSVVRPGFTPCSFALCTCLAAVFRLSADVWALIAPRVPASVRRPASRLS